MKKIIKTAVRNFRILKQVKSEILWLTENIPCVNLSVSGIKALKFYNNSDLIAVLTYDELENLLFLGSDFFRCAIYSLCKKYSIDNY